MKAWQIIYEGEAAYHRIQQRHSQCHQSQPNIQSSLSQQNQFLQPDNTYQSNSNQILSNFNSFANNDNSKSKQTHKFDTNQKYQHYFNNSNCNNNSNNGHGNNIRDDHEYVNDKNISHGSITNVNGSFNGMDNKQNESIVLDIGGIGVELPVRDICFETLIEKIEVQTGRKLKQKGVDRLIETIKYKIQHINQKQKQNTQTHHKQVLKQTHHIQVLKQAHHKQVLKNSNTTNIALPKRSQNQKPINKQNRQNSYKIGSSNYTQMHDLNRVLKSKNVVNKQQQLNYKKAVSKKIK